MAILERGLQGLRGSLKYSGESETTKTALFCHVCRDELKKLLRFFDIGLAEGNTTITLKQVLDAFASEIYASFKFLEVKQGRGEKFADYFSRLKCAIVECNYGALEDCMLREKMIQRLWDKALPERLICETS